MFRWSKWISVIWESFTKTDFDMSLRDMRHLHNKSQISIISSSNLIGNAFIVCSNNNLTISLNAPRRAIPASSSRYFPYFSLLSSFRDQVVIVLPLTFPLIGTNNKYWALFVFSVCFHCFYSVSLSLSCPVGWVFTFAKCVIIDRGTHSGIYGE